MARRWVPLAAAGGAAAVVGVVVALSQPASSDVPAAFGTASAPPAVPAEPLVVRPGDTVRASGQVIAVPGGVVKFCAPSGRSLLPGPPDCGSSVPVTGVDVTGFAEVDGRLVGTAALRGVWRDGVLAVAEQTPAEQERRPSPIGEPVPCAPPPGGWAPKSADTKALNDYVRGEHPDRFRRPRVVHPQGVPASTAQWGDAPQVMVVEVVRGDVAAEGRELRARFDGNLCVVDASGRRSLAEQEALRDEVSAEWGLDPTTGIYSMGGDDVVRVDMVVLTPELAERFGRFGPDVELNPWLRRA